MPFSLLSSFRLQRPWSLSILWLAVILCGSALHTMHSGVMADTAAPKLGPCHYRVGYIEPVHIQEAGFSLDAKLDSGASYASLRANVLNETELNLKPSKKNNRYYLKNEPKIGSKVKFEVKDAKGQVHTLALPLLRVAKIKRKEGGLLYRPVVKMTFMIGDKPVTGEVNLAPRPNFKYAVLVGRNMLGKAHLLVDSSKRHLTEVDDTIIPLIPIDGCNCQS